MKFPMYVTIPMKLASWLVCGCVISDSLYLLKAKVHVIYTVLCPKEGGSWPLKFQFLAFQDKAFGLSHIHEVYEV